MTMQESFHTIDKSTSMDGKMDSKKAVIIAGIFVVFIVIVGVYFYKNSNTGSKGLTEQDRQAFVKYAEQYQKDHPTPTITPKEQQAFIAYVASTNSSVSATTKSNDTVKGTSSSDATAKTPTQPTASGLTTQQQAFINYVSSHTK